MASASKSTTLYNGNGYGFILTASFTEGTPSVANNYSPVTCTATFAAQNSNWQTGNPSTLSIYWHDNRENYDRLVASINFAGINQWETKTASGTINVTHKDDGTLSGYAYAYFNKGSTTTSWACNSGGVSTNLTPLTTIARASVPTIEPNTFNIGDTITIKTNRKSTLFTHDVIFYFGNYSYTIATDVTDSVTFDTSIVANEMYQQIPNAAEGIGNVTLVTYNGETQVGSKYSTFTAKVINSNPTFNAAYQDINSTTTSITNDNQQIIRNNSALQISITNASAKNYATLSSLTAIINGVTYTGSLRGTGGSIDVGTLNLSSNTTAQVILTDSRGIKTTQNLNITILNWELPTAIISLQRQDNFYSETDINVNADYSSLDGKNTITIKARYKKTTDASYSAYVTLQDDVTSVLTLDNNYQWDVQVLVQDEIGSTTYNLTLSRGMPITYYDKIKSSTSFNCFPSNDKSVEIDGDLLVNGENILARILGYGQVAHVVDGDWDDACGDATGFYMGNGLTNSPPGTSVAGWWWVIHIVHNSTYQRQIAFSFLNNSEVYTRMQNNGTWNNWVLINGEQYSTSEEVIGEWIDGKPLYRKTISTGTLPNGGGMNVPHNISNIDNVVRVYGYAYRSSDGVSLPLPHSAYDISCISCYANKTNICIVTYTDRTAFTTSYVTLEYTKTTD